MSLPPVLYQRSYARSAADLILVVGAEAKEIPVHRLILFCASPYFERRVHYHLMENQGAREAVTRIRMPDVSVPVMTQIVKYCYSGLVDVSSSNVEELMRVADMFSIDAVVHACRSFLEDTRGGRSGASAGRTSFASRMKRRWNPRTRA